MKSTKICGFTIYSKKEVENNSSGITYYGIENIDFGDVGIKFYNNDLEREILDIYTKIHSFSIQYYTNWELTQKIEELMKLYNYLLMVCEPIIIAPYSENIKEVFGSISITKDSNIKEIDFIGFDVCVYAGFSLIKQGYIDHQEYFDNIKINFNEYGLLTTKEDCINYFNLYLEKCKYVNLEQIDSSELIDFVELYKIELLI